MLMMAALPGNLTFAAKHTLFKVPILGRIIRMAGAKPVHRAQDSSEGDGGNRSAKNSNLIESLGDAVAMGGRVAIFPEGVSHLEAHPVRLRTGAARILLHAIRKANAEGKQAQCRATGIALYRSAPFQRKGQPTSQQSIADTPLPGEDGAPAPTEAEVAEFGEQAYDRAWCSAITELLKSEMDRCNQAQETWEDRELIWRARRMVHVYRANQGQAPSGPLPYEQALLGSRRVRAAWQFKSEHEPELTERVESRFREHHGEMNQLGLRSWEISNREERISKRAFIKNLTYWIWSISWMLGVVSWGAVIGSIPYMLTRVITNQYVKRESNKSGLGSMKILCSVVLYPIWWLMISIPIGWLISSPESPIQDVQLPSLILPLLAGIPGP